MRWLPMVAAVFGLRSTCSGASMVHIIFQSLYLLRKGGRMMRYRQCTMAIDINNDLLRDNAVAVLLHLRTYIGVWAWQAQHHSDS